MNARLLEMGTCPMFHGCATECRYELRVYKFLDHPSPPLMKTLGLSFPSLR